MVYVLGGGEAAYNPAPVRLKETYSRLDVMKAAHLTALGQIEPWEKVHHLNALPKRSVPTCST
jgi:hypothetical protein